jgi:hypothetical protein
MRDWTAQITLRWFRKLQFARSRILIASRANQARKGRFIADRDGVIDAVRLAGFLAKPSLVDAPRSQRHHCRRRRRDR